MRVLAVLTLFVCGAFSGLARAEEQSTPNPMMTRYEITTPHRLALTPFIDGRFDDEEWDPLNVNTEGPTTLQWEPQSLYLGALVPVGKDMIFSIDLNADGWLVGDDNLELRATWDNGAPRVSVRRLDATNRNSPVWVAQPFLDALANSAGLLEESQWTLELQLKELDTKGFVIGRTLAVRSDVVPSSEGSAESYMPRACSFVFLRYERGRGLPPGMEWESEFKARTVVPGESIKIRLAFKNTGGTVFRRGTMRSEGLARQSAKEVTLPFPAFDRKGRSFVDYETSIAPDASRGYRILRGEFDGTNGEKVMVQTSYQVSDLLDIEWKLPPNLIRSQDSRVIKGTLILRSNTLNRLDGKVTVTLPSAWSVNKGDERKFLIYHARGIAQLKLDLIAPQGAFGLIPIVVTAEVGGQKVEKKSYLAIK